MFNVLVGNNLEHETWNMKPWIPESVSTTKTTLPPSMSSAESNHDKILNILGLGRTLNHLDRRSFQTYVPSKYRGSELEERDAVHRMSEIVLLHDTGLRLTYLSCESYDGESVEYKLLGIEIVTTGGDTHRVLDVNFEQRIVITKDDRISFDNLSMKPV
jgi:hypothetical protein